MNFTLTIKEKTKDGIFCDMVSEDGSHFFYALMHSYGDEKTGFWSKVKAGIFKCARWLSPHFGYVVFLLQGVSGAEMIEIHRGNVNADSKGCILLGLAQGELNGQKAILHSEDAFKKFMEIQKDVSEFELTVVDLA